MAEEVEIVEEITAEAAGAFSSELYRASGGGQQIFFSSFMIIY